MVQLVPCKHVQKHNHILLYMIVHSLHCCLGAPNNRSTGREASGEQRLLHLCSGPGAISVVWGNFSHSMSLGVSYRNQSVLQPWFQERVHWFMRTLTATCSISDYSAGLANMYMKEAGVNAVVKNKCAHTENAKLHPNKLPEVHAYSSTSK